MQTMRVFAAIDIGPPASSVLLRIVDQLRSETSNVRWVRPEQLHLTIKFAGDMDNRELPVLCQRLREACGKVEPFVATIRGLGTFPRNKPPRIIWAGIDEGTAELSAIHESLDQSLAEFGIPREARSFSPHMTLGRVGRGADLIQLSELVEQHSGSLYTQFEVNEVRVLESIREKGKVAYEPVDTVELGWTEDNYDLDDEDQ